MQATKSLEQFLDMLRPHLKYLGTADDLEMDQELVSAGLDFMSAIDLLLEIEEHFAITFPDDRLIDETFATANALWSVIGELSNPERNDTNATKESV